MKKIILLVTICIFSIFSLFSEENESLESVNGYFDFSEEGVEVYISPNWILFDGEKIDRNEFRLDKNGYYYIKDNIVLFDQFHHLLAWHNTTLNMHPLVESKNYYGINSDYNASSFLTEKLGKKEIAYTTDCLNSILAKPYIKTLDFFSPSIKNQERFFIWNEEHKPWVANGGNKGIGSTVTANFENKVNCISFLNGYVDPYHPDYYKKNSRIKDVKITDETNGIDYYFTLDDEVRVQFFMLNNTTNKVTMTVLSVYQGEKYQDICLSMFSGVYADTYIDWIVFRELIAAKENVKTAFKDYEETVQDYPERVSYNIDLITHDWELYNVLVYDRIKKEFGDQWIEPDIEFYRDSNLSINLKVDHGNAFISFYVDDRIKSVSCKFNGPNVATSKSNKKTIIFDDPSTYAYKTERGAYEVYLYNMGDKIHTVLAKSVWLQIEYTSGIKKEIFVPEEGLSKVRRFGELLISVCDLK